MPSAGTNPVHFWIGDANESFTPPIPSQSRTTLSKHRPVPLLSRRHFLKRGITKPSGWWGGGFGVGVKMRKSILMVIPFNEGVAFYLLARVLYRDLNISHGFSYIRSSTTHKFGKLATPIPQTTPFYNPPSNTQPPSH